ncbi:MAG TPA: TetR/AcrR family transcriptional regulator [Firmicutes bacterium]|jgi:AcrR family transcriptional regulator|nr:TetR/AcrR family transcriptional regulator [Bacillota bacterium]
MQKKNKLNNIESGKRTSQKVSLTRKDVLKEAAKLIRLHGYHGTSTQMIADALGISKSTFFHHAKSKQDMLFEIINEPMQKVYPSLKKIYSQQISPSQKLRLAIKNHIVNLVENVEVVSVLLQERDCLKSPYKEIIEPEREGYTEIFCRIIKDGMASGEFLKVHPNVAALAILGMCNWLVQWYNPEGEVSVEEIVEMYTDFSLRMLKP